MAVAALDSRALSRARGFRGAPAAAVDEEPAALRRAALRGQARRRHALAARRSLAFCGVLRGVQRRVPRQRRARRAARPGAPGQARCGRSQAASCRPRAALGIAAVLVVLAFGGAAVLGWGSVAFLAGVHRPPGRLHRRAQAPRPDRRARDRGAVRDPRSGRRGRRSTCASRPWLLICTALLALFLALGKRRGELVLVGADATPGRPVLEGYSLALVDQLVSRRRRLDRDRLLALHVHRA